jgi:hypothetical protein
MTSRLFHDFAFDLNNWTMDAAFLARYIEMKHDIPCSDGWRAEQGPQTQGTRQTVA